MLPVLAITLLAVLPLTAATPDPGNPPAESAAPTPPPAALAWLGRVSRDAPGAFAAPRPFNAGYRVTWGGLTAAHVDAQLSAPTGGDEYRTSVKTSTAGAARALYKLDATHLSIINRRTFHPIRLEQTEQGAKKQSFGQVDFDDNGALRTSRDPAKKDATVKSLKTRRFNYPGMLDMEGALLSLRSLPLANGDEKTFLLMTAGSPYLATVKVLSRAKVKVAAGEYPAIECTLKLEKITNAGGLEPRKGFKSAHAWLSDDADRLLIKAEAEVFVGSVQLELEKVTFPEGTVR